MRNGLIDVIERKWLVRSSVLAQVLSAGIGP
jgi:hypothetical protein